MSHIVRCFRSYQELPDHYAEVLTVAATKGFFYEQPWFEFLMKDYYAEDSEFFLYSVEDSESSAPLLLMPMRFTQIDGAVHGAKTLSTVGHMENFSLLSVIFSDKLESQKDRLNVLGALFNVFKCGDSELQHPKVDVLRLWPVDVGGEMEDIVYGALKQAGFLVQQYENSYNQYENTSGLSYEEYFENRSSNHRYNVRRRQRNLEKAGNLEFCFYSDGAEEDIYQKCMDGYILSSVESWKSPGSMTSRGILDLIKLTAKLGHLRLGVIFLNGRPMAAQFWIVSGGVGHCMRLAYDEAYKKDAPGVVLTHFIMEHLLDTDHVDAVDFGYGDDEYKSKWMKDSRHYAGFMAFNSSTILGLFFGAKHIVGRKVKRILRRITRRA
ncbi:MAG: GNAT family N-acetyltransferase [Porticoccus sp.]|nr:GNAT family N-acetyltransferase [Porticoccus sp.]